MTNKQAIERLEWVKKRICDITFSPECIEALDLAIKALEERPQGEWSFDSEFLMIGSPYGSYKCSNCGTHTDDKEDNFCWNCGADMRGKNEKRE